MDALVIVDGANVVGSVPDGWWKDRAGAARRLRDRLAGLPAKGLPGLAPPVDVVLVLEGAARGVADEPADITVVGAVGSGDDTIVELVAAAGDRHCTVVTADRGLRERVQALGADVVGPRTVR
jgi:hypothetical protein